MVRLQAEQALDASKMAQGYTTSVDVRAAVVGCGRMGKLHARTYAKMSGVTLVGVYDAIAKAAEEVAGEFGGKAFSSIDQLADEVAAVSIAAPTEHHLAVAEPFLRRGVACLIEKPLARNSAEGRKIVELG